MAEFWHYKGTVFIFWHENYFEVTLTPGAGWLRSLRFTRHPNQLILLMSYAICHLCHMTYFAIYVIFQR